MPQRRPVLAARELARPHRPAACDDTRAARPVRAHASRAREDREGGGSARRGGGGGGVRRARRGGGRSSAEDPRCRDHLDGARAPRVAQEEGHMAESELYEKGMKIRRAVLGDEYVDRALANSDDFSEDLQRLVTEFCWGATWGRGVLSLKQ